MTDHVSIFPPGWRLLDSNGNPISGGTIEFYTAGTTTPLTVYSDIGLSVSIGTSVTTDSGGYPASGGNKVIIYTSLSSLKVIGKDSSGSTLWTHDNFQPFASTAAGGASLIKVPIDVTSSTTIVLTSADYGHTKQVDITSASATVTLPAASTCSGQVFGLIRKGSTGGNTLSLLAVGADTIAGSASISLTKEGDGILVASNSSNAYEIIAFYRRNMMSGITSDMLAASVSGGLYQIGDVKFLPHETVPALWLECNGAAISRTTYSALFAVIGTTWGQGDGSTTFNLPDMRGGFPRIWDHGAGIDPHTAALSVTGAANNGSGLIRLTVASTATLYTGQKVTVASVGGVSAATGTWTITVISATTFDLQGSTFSGTYTSGGTVNARYALKTGGQTGDHVGSYETDAFQKHTHDTSSPGSTQSVGTGGGASPTTLNSTYTSGNPTNKAQATETRPYNFNMMAVIYAGA